EQAELDDEIVDAALEATGTTHLMDRDITVLSGGERARVAMARASAAHPGCTFRRAHRSDGYSLSGTVFGPHQRASLARGNRDRCFARLKCRCRLLRFHRLPRPRTHSPLGDVDTVFTTDILSEVYGWPIDVSKNHAGVHIAPRRAAPGALHHSLITSTSWIDSGSSA